MNGDDLLVRVYEHNSVVMTFRERQTMGLATSAAGGDVRKVTQAQGVPRAVRGSAGHNCFSALSSHSFTLPVPKASLPSAAV